MMMHHGTSCCLTRGVIPLLCSTGVPVNLSWAASPPFAAQALSSFPTLSATAFLTTCLKVCAIQHACCARRPPSLHLSPLPPLPAPPPLTHTQGKITAMSQMRDEQRLELLKEIGGTRVYEERRKESLRVMAEADSRNAQIRDMVSGCAHRHTGGQAEAR